MISIPQSAALLTRGGTGISSSDFYTLLNKKQTSAHKSKCVCVRGWGWGLDDPLTDISEGREQNI
jgi:hypothetical protein